MQRAATSAFVATLPARAAYREAEILAAACTRKEPRKDGKLTGVERLTGMPQAPNDRYLLSGLPEKRGR